LARPINSESSVRYDVKTIAKIAGQARSGGDPEYATSRNTQTRIQGPQIHTFYLSKPVEMKEIFKNFVKTQ
jgi:hypothetical protein